MVTRLYDFYVQVPYYYPGVSLIYLQMNFVHCLLSIMFILYQMDSIASNTDISVIILLLFPTAFRFGAVWRYYLLKNVPLIKQNQITSPIIMDLYVRALNDLCNLDYHVYCS